MPTYAYEQTWSFPETSELGPLMIRSTSEASSPDALAERLRQEEEDWQANQADDDAIAAQYGWPARRRATGRLTRICVWSTSTFEGAADLQLAL